MGLNKRLALQSELTSIAPKAWYQRPPSNKMSYPCIVYKSIAPSIMRADNRPYRITEGYEILYISQSEDHEIVAKMLERFEHCSAGAPYISDNLYHYVFTLYY